MCEPADRLAEWFDSLGTEYQCKRQLADIVRGVVGLLTPVWHPLGFIHAKLADVPDGGTYRLHLWSSEYRHVGEQCDRVHDHLFNVNSRVVAGAVHNMRYRFAVGESEDYYETRVDYRPDCIRLIETGVFGRLHVVQRERIKAPGKYFVPRGELHETVPPKDGLALTVVRTSEPVDYKPRAIFRRAAPAHTERRRCFCNRELWRRLLKEVIPL